MLEQWKGIPGYNGKYQISNLGRVKSFCRSKAGQTIKPKYSLGYAQTLCYKYGKGKTFAIHRLVAELFIPNPNNLPQINHLDETKLNNRVDNLEWCTAKQNINYGTRNERAVSNRRFGPVFVITKPGHHYWFKNAATATRAVGGKQQSVYACLHGKQSGHRGFHFEYA